MSLTYIWKGQDDALLSAERIVPREQVAEMLEAGRMLEAVAQRQAQLDEQARQVFEQARAQGHAQGLAQGRQEGCAQVLQGLRSEQVFLARLHQDMAEVVAQVLMDILADDRDGDLFRRRVLSMLQAAAGQRLARLIVAPSRVEEVERLLSEATGAGDARWLRVVADPRLQTADMVLESETSFFDGRVQEQGASVRRLLEQAFGSDKTVAIGAPASAAGGEQ